MLRESPRFSPSPNIFKKNKPAHSLIFAAFDGEESGLRGSRAFVEKPPVAKESIVLNASLDMIAHNDINELYASGTYHYPKLKKPLEQIAKTARVKLILGHDRPEQKSDDWTNQSDHFSFHQRKSHSFISVSKTTKIITNRPMIL